jgi:hypothetical protein
MKKTVLVTTAILLSLCANALDDIAKILTSCADKLNGVIWTLMTLYVKH